MSGLTRGEAHQLVDDCFTDDGERSKSPAALRELAAHWEIAGHWNENVTPEEWYTILHEFVDESAFNGDAERANGPKDSDPTELVAP